MASDGQSTGLSRTSTIVTIVSTLAGLVIGYLTLAKSVDWPPFSQEPQGVVRLFKGDNPNHPVCSGSACAFIGIELRGFEPNTQVRCSFDSTDGPSAFKDHLGRTDAEGFLREPTLNFFGRPGGWVSARCFTPKREGRGELNPW